jgi:hypothetical protein
MNRAFIGSVLAALLLDAAPAMAQELEPQGPERGPAPHLVLGVDGGLANMVHGAIFTIDGKVGGGARLGSWALTVIFEGAGGGGSGVQGIHQAAYWLFPHLDLARLDAPLRWHVFAGGGYGRFDASNSDWSFHDRKAIYGGGAGLGSGLFDVTIRYVAPAVPLDQGHGTFGLGLQLLVGVRYDDTFTR